MVLAYRLDASSHHVSHHNHSCGNVLMATWWIILFGRSWNWLSIILQMQKKKQDFEIINKKYNLLSSFYIFINTKIIRFTYLIKIWQAVWILTQCLILSSQPISGCDTTEPFEIHHV